MSRIEHLREAAILAARLFEGEPAVVATCISGSLATGFVDEFSDAEVMVIWSDPLRPEDSRALIEGRVDRFVSSEPFYLDDPLKAYGASVLLDLEQTDAGRTLS